MSLPDWCLVRFPFFRRFSVLNDFSFFLCRKLVDSTYIKCAHNVRTGKRERTLTDSRCLERFHTSFHIWYTYVIDRTISRMNRETKKKKKKESLSEQKKIFLQSNSRILSTTLSLEKENWHSCLQHIFFCLFFYS